MPNQSDKLTQLRENAGPGEIPYISKSRLLKYVKCPEQFRWSYIQGLKEPETTAMARGTSIHTAFELFYENVAEYVFAKGVFPDELSTMLPDVKYWADYVEPFVSNFLVFEYDRWDAALESVETRELALDLWLPVAVEEEVWWHEPEEIGDPPWMGYADVIYNTASVPGLDGSGVTIIDFKTGKTPKPQYRSDDIYLQGHYYAMLFERAGYDVDFVGGYYPKDGDLLFTGRDSEREDYIVDVVREMVDLSRTNVQPYLLKEQPLCKWGPGVGENECSFYRICQSTWGVPVDEEERFRDLIASGLRWEEVAEELGTSVDAVRYWKYKLDL